MRDGSGKRGLGAHVQLDHSIRAKARLRAADYWAGKAQASRDPALGAFSVAPAIVVPRYRSRPVNLRPGIKRRVVRPATQDGIELLKLGGQTAQGGTRSRRAERHRRST